MLYRHAQSPSCSTMLYVVWWLIRAIVSRIKVLWSLVGDINVSEIHSASILREDEERVSFPYAAFLMFPRKISKCLPNYRVCVEKKNQLDATEWFIALIICSTCFGHFYAHHQELENICVLLPAMVCSAWLLVVGARNRAAGYVSRKRDVARLQVVQHPSSWTYNLLHCSWPPTTSNQALHTIGGNNTHVASSSWWWA